MSLFGQPGGNYQQPDPGYGRLIQSIEANTKTMRDHLAAQIADGQQRPRIITINASGIVDANGYALASFPAVVQGRRQHVRSLIVGPATWTSSAVVGTATAFVQASPPQLDVQPPTSQVTDYASSLPNVAFYSNSQLVVNERSSLYILFAGVTLGTGTEMVAVAAVEDWPNYAFGRTVRD